MKSRKPAFDRLRARYPDLERAIATSAAMQPFAHDLRVLLDPRSLEERIDAAVRQHYHEPLTRLSTTEQTGVLQRHLELNLLKTSLERAPCLSVLRERLTLMQKDGISDPGIAPAYGSPRYAGTIAST